jgi:uncharacterized protein
MNSQILIPFNYKRLGDHYLVVNLIGQYSLLSSLEFQNLLNGESSRDDLCGSFYIERESQISDLITRYRYQKRYLNIGTSLFIFVLTNRCNQSCVYCQASRKTSSSPQYDMTQIVAKKAQDLILSLPNTDITIEFQGGEPLLNFDILKFIVEYSKKFQQTKIHYTLVSNLMELDEYKLFYLVDNGVKICTSLDGNEELHNYNRPSINGNSFKILNEKLELLRKHHVKVEAIQTTTKSTLHSFKELIDQYVILGFDSIYLRTLNPFGFASKTFSDIGYSPFEFLDFYFSSLKYIIELNKQGVFLKERTACIFLTKILDTSDLNYMDLRSPCGATIGQMAINYNGDFYTCDEGRMLGESGDDSFRIGNVRASSVYQLYDNSVTKAVCLASCSECASRCYQCAYQPYCGICPIINYSKSGSLNNNNEFRCIVNKGIIDILFSYLLNDSEATTIFKNWIQN